jgi:hypothetical protein
VSIVIRPSLLRSSLLAIEMESSKFSPTALSEMKTYDVKNSYYPQPKGVDSEREEFVNSVQFDGSLQNLILYGQSLNFFVEVSI